MADDGAKISLFGAAPRRAANKPNPYANIPEHGGNAAAPAAAAPAKQPVRDELAPEDRNRTSLLAGGRKEAAPPPVAPAAVGDAEPPPPPPEDDGAIELDFDNLNMTEGMSATGGQVPEELNFDAIDADLTHFAQDPVIREALSRGVDLRQYARTVDSELRSMEMLSIGDYVKEADSIAGLFEQVTNCEAVLGQMAGMLQSFADNLGGISEEIRSLQEQSLAMSVKMANRKALNAKIRGFLAKVAVPESLIDHITDGPLDDGWFADLRSLSEKIEFTYGHGGSARGGGGSGGAHAAPSAAPPSHILSDLTVSPYTTPAGKDSLPVVEKLRSKATSRLRDHLLRGIGELVKPKTSMQKQQEYVLMKASPGMAFLTDHAPEVAREVRAAYADTVGRSIADVFKRYSDDLSRAVQPPPTARGETIVDVVRPPHAVAAAVAATAAGVGASGGEPFSLTAGGRLSVLQHAADAPLTAHVVAAERTRLPYEAMFRSLQRHLMDVAQAEDSFDRRFFGERSGTDVFGAVIARTLTVLFAGLEEYLAAAASDAPGLMLLVALVAAHRRMLADRGSKCLDPYFDRVVLLLWPRFKACLDANITAVRATAKEPSPVLLKHVGAIDVGVHPVAKRFAEFVSSLLLLHRKLAEQHCSDDMLPHHISVLCREMDALLVRMSTEAAPSRTGRVVFLINNYSAVYNTATERGVHPDDAMPFETALKTQVDHYVDAEMETHFRALSSFVRKTEEEAIAAAAAQGITLPPSGGPDGASGPRLPEGVNVLVSPTDAETLIRDFGMSWRAGVKALSDNVLRYFPDPRHGLAVLKRVMGAFVGLYERFTGILGRAFPPSAPFLREVVPTATLFYEIKRYSRAFETA